MTLWQRIKFVFGMYELSPRQRNKYVFKRPRDAYGRFEKVKPALPALRKIACKKVQVISANNS